MMSQEALAHEWATAVGGIVRRVTALVEHPRVAPWSRAAYLRGVTDALNEITDELNQMPLVRRQAVDE